MTHRVTVVKSTRPNGSKAPEYRIVCDKCGLIDKSERERSAKLVAKRHEDLPNRPGIIRKEN
jgi:hypothetical protein